MSSASSAAFRSWRLRIGSCLLAGLLALQGVMVGVSIGSGPAHVHREPARIMVLEDVRRMSGSGFVETHPHGPWGHSHQTVLRHHHAAADPSVVIDAANAADEGGLLHDLVVSAFVAVLLLALLWAPAALSQQRAARAAWQPSFAMARLLERPPQPA